MGGRSTLKIVRQSSTQPETALGRGPGIAHLIRDLETELPRPVRAAAGASCGACNFIVVDFGRNYPAFLSCFSRSRIAETTISLIVRSKLSKRRYSKLVRIMVAKLAR